MDSAQSALQNLESSNQKLYRKLCGDAKVLQKSPLFRRLLKNVGLLVGKDELSFIPTAGATHIDTHLAALREGAKIPLHIIDLMSKMGESLEDVEHDSVEKRAERYPV